jgi:hypothetical protein
MEQRRVVVIGAPSGAGACGVGQEQTPTADWHVAAIDIEG